ncbi:MAG: HAMP domain-containing sensor histidine kinase [Bacteroidota bacterium]
MQLVLSHNEKLESVVKERTLKLTKANAEKDKLFSIIAHDLRSPFSSLISILELNDNDMLEPEELKVLLQKTRKNVDQIHLTLNNLLFWAKGQMEMAGSNPESFNLQTMAEQLSLVYQPLSVSKNLKLITSASGSAEVFADKNEIDLVLRNLVDNALKFSPQGSTIRILTEQEVEKVKISISNDVPPDSTTKLETLLHTDEFLSTPGTNNEQGIGLGLHLCREYVQLNSGELQIKVNNNQVTISFSLPAAKG